MNALSVFFRAASSALLGAVLLVAASGCDRSPSDSTLDAAAKRSTELSAAVERANGEKTRRVEALLAIERETAAARAAFRRDFLKIDAANRDALWREFQSGALSQENAARPEIVALFERWRDWNDAARTRSNARSELARLEVALGRAEKELERKKRRERGDGAQGDSPLDAADELTALVAAADADVELTPRDVLASDAALGPADFAETRAPRDDATRLKDAAARLDAAAAEPPGSASAWIDVCATLEDVREIAPIAELRERDAAFSAAIARLDEIAVRARTANDVDSAAAESAKNFQRLVDPEKIAREDAARERAARRALLRRRALAVYFGVLALVVAGAVVVAQELAARPRAVVRTNAAPSGGTVEIRVSPEGAPGVSPENRAAKIVFCLLVFAGSTLVVGPIVGLALACAAALVVDGRRIAATVGSFALWTLSLGGCLLVAAAFLVALLLLGIGVAILCFA